MPRDEDAAVARQRLFFRTQKRDTQILDGAGANPLQTFTEQRRLRQFRILYLSIYVAGAVAASCSQFRSKINIANPTRGEVKGKRLTVELRVQPAVGLRSHIRHRRDAVLQQESDQLLDAARGVANSVNRFAHFAPARLGVMIAAHNL